MYYFYVYKNGFVGIGTKIPKDTTLLDVSKSKEDLEKHLVACRLMYDDSPVISTMFDAHRASLTNDPQEKERITMCCRYPSDTPMEALDRWCKWRKIGPYLGKEMSKGL